MGDYGASIGPNLNPWFVPLGLVSAGLCGEHERQPEREEGKGVAVARIWLPPGVRREEVNLPDTHDRRGSTLSLLLLFLLLLLPPLRTVYSACFTVRSAGPFEPKSLWRKAVDRLLALSRFAADNDCVVAGPRFRVFSSFMF